MYRTTYCIGFTLLSDRTGNDERCVSGGNNIKIGNKYGTGGNGTTTSYVDGESNDGGSPIGTPPTITTPPLAPKSLGTDHRKFSPPHGVTP